MRIKRVLLSVLICYMAVHSAGCASLKEAGEDIIGIGMADLVRAKENGVSKVVPLGYDAAFEGVRKIAEKKYLYIAREDRKQGFIVLMNFPKQVDTTRIGVFFEPVSDSSTKVTLSSLSSTALKKARVMVLEELAGQPSQGN
ncbi:MAG: hypothetical protein PHT95_02980 [Candidatus Omnitrophica bacterium]|nr:hypothetical protein [Candidatus Omnitrophota bacterium]